MKTPQTRRTGWVWVSATVVAATVTACGGGGSSKESAKAKPGATVTKIGFLLDDQHERWVRDRELFLERLKMQDVQVTVEIADGDQEKQNAQADKLLADGVNVLVVVPHDMNGAASLVEKAKAKKVPVISYDRLIRDADVDLYITFENEKVGEMQANYVVQKVPTGNYVIIHGAKSDNNSVMVRDGRMRVLEPYIKKGDIKVVAEGWTDWKPEQAAALVTAALDKNKNRVAAILAPNDVTAGAVVEVLEKRGLAGKIPVTGQDAELDAARRIVAGTQAMTVYKPISALTRLAAAWATRLADGEKPDAATTLNNGKRDVPTMMVAPIAVDKGNLDTILIGDGFLKKDAV